MAVAKRLKAFLDESRVKYTAARHPLVFTAQEIAAAQHVPGRQLAKSVLVKTDTGVALAVLPAIQLVDLKKLKVLLRAKKLSIAKETDIKAHFPDMEVGAMSPFGHLYQVTVVIDRQLGESADIVFNAGSHTDTIKMRYADFARLAAPKVGAFGLPVAGPRGGRRPKAAAKRKGKARRPARPKKKSAKKPSKSSKKRGSSKRRR